MISTSLTHYVKPEGAMRNLTSDIHNAGHTPQNVQILRVALPGKVDAFCEHAPWNVLNAFHEIYEEVLTAWSHRRKPNTAIPKNSSCYTVP